MSVHRKKFAIQIPGFLHCRLSVVEYYVWVEMKIQVYGGLDSIMKVG